MILLLSYGVAPEPGTTRFQTQMRPNPYVCIAPFLLSFARMRRHYVPFSPLCQEHVL
jgi:hypothetical protein